MSSELLTLAPVVCARPRGALLLYPNLSVQRIVSSSREAGALGGPPSKGPTSVQLSSGSCPLDPNLAAILPHECNQAPRGSAFCAMQKEPYRP